MAANSNQIYAGDAQKYVGQGYYPQLALQRNSAQAVIEDATGTLIAWDDIPIFEICQGCVVHGSGIFTVNIDCTLIINLRTTWDCTAAAGAVNSTIYSAIQTNAAAGFDFEFGIATEKTTATDQNILTHSVSIVHRFAPGETFGAFVYHNRGGAGARPTLLHANQTGWPHCEIVITQLS